MRLRDRGRVSGICSTTSASSSLLLVFPWTVSLNDLVAPCLPAPVQAEMGVSVAFPAVLPTRGCEHRVMARDSDWVVSCSVWVTHER